MFSGEHCCRDLTLAQEYLRFVDAFKAETDFYWDVDKNRKRDAIGRLQTLLGKCKTAAESASYVSQIHAELQRQYDSCTTLEPNDTVPRLNHKILIVEEVLLGLMETVGIKVDMNAHKRKLAEIGAAVNVRAKFMADMSTSVRRCAVGKLIIVATISKVLRTYIKEILNNICIVNLHLYFKAVLSKIIGRSDIRADY